MFGVSFSLAGRSKRASGNGDLVVDGRFDGLLQEKRLGEGTRLLPQEDDSARELPLVEICDRVTEAALPTRPGRGFDDTAIGQRNFESSSFDPQVLNSSCIE